MTEGLSLTTFGVLLSRPGTLVVAVPFLGGQYVPASVKVALTVILAVLMAPVVTVPAGLSPIALVLVMARESAIGLALALSVQALVAGAQLAGHLAGFQIGLSYAALVDPQTGARNNILATLYASLATIAFLGLNAHHALLRALAGSYRALPIGTSGFQGPAPEVVAWLLGVVFQTGLKLAAPVVVVLLLVELAMGLLSRAAPALNLMVFGFPIRVIVGLLALAGAIGTLPSAVAHLVEPLLAAAIRLAGMFR